MKDAFVEFFELKQSYSHTIFLLGNNYSFEAVQKGNLFYQGARPSGRLVGAFFVLFKKGIKNFLLKL